MFTLKLHSISAFRPRDLSLFSMTNHVVNNSIRITSLKNGVRSQVDVRDKPWNFILVQGVPVPYFALWTMGIVVAVTAAIFVIPLLAGDGNGKLRPPC